MLHSIIWILSWLLVIGAMQQGYGAWRWIGRKSAESVWSPGSSLAAPQIVFARHLMLVWPGDGRLALLVCLSAAAWTGVAYGFGRSIGKMADPHVI
ncbi:MAG: hypothetical protein ABI832_03380 [bacterium]